MTSPRLPLHSRAATVMSMFDPSPSPPAPSGVEYSTSADISVRPYEGERSIAALLHFDEIVPRVLSFMSTVEMLFVQTVRAREGGHTRRRAARQRARFFLLRLTFLLPLLTACLCVAGESLLVSSFSVCSAVPHSPIAHGTVLESHRRVGHCILHANHRAIHFTH